MISVWVVRTKKAYGLKIIEFKYKFLFPDVADISRIPDLASELQEILPKKTPQNAVQRAEGIYVVLSILRAFFFNRIFYFRWKMPEVVAAAATPPVASGSGKNSSRIPVFTPAQQKIMLKTESEIDARRTKGIA